MIKSQPDELLTGFGSGKYYICHLILYCQMGIFRKISDSKIIEGIRLQDDKILNWLYDNYFPAVKNHVLQKQRITG